MPTTEIALPPRNVARPEPPVNVPVEASAVAMPQSLRLEASTNCQLKCPVCPTAKGEIRKYIGSGFLSFEDFKRLIDDNPSVSLIELSNYGEILLSPHLRAILEYAHDRGVVLTAANGVNLNNVREEVLEALVKFRLLFLTCAIDATDQETYVKYRIGGNYDRVIANLEKLHALKRKHRSPFPLLRWQFIVFGHNEHQIESARALAQRFGMHFQLKKNWDSEFSPVSRNHPETNADNREVVTGICSQMWNLPQINWDGKILGCCVNFWGDYGNVFSAGLASGLRSPRLEYARQMLLGKAEARKDIPCTACHLYQRMAADHQWLDLKEVQKAGATRLNFLARWVKRIGWKRLTLLLKIIGPGWNLRLVKLLRVT